MTALVRVAAAQFATGTDVADNLATTLRMIDRAAAEAPGAQVIVLPEFCNHLSVYESAEHCWDVAIALDGEWIAAIGAAAARAHAWVQVNCTVRRQHPQVTNTNLLFAPDGSLRAANDKTVLMGAEGIHLSPADDVSTLVDAHLATRADGSLTVRIGTYACMDGVVPEVPRTVAVRGAQLMLNSLNSFALDEAELHVPVRAAENRTWVVACCKVGPLLPPDKVAEFSAAMGVPADMLCGAGESQIVAPDGAVVARGPRVGEAIVWADIDLDLAGLPRPDGTDIRAARRPSLYAALAEPTPAQHDHARAATITAAAGSSLAAVLEATATAVPQLIVLPELSLEASSLDAVAAALDGTDTVVVGSMRDGDAHIGVAIASDGVLARQAQLHSVARHPWSTALGDALHTLDLPWGRLAIIVGDDLAYPEVARLAALASVDVVAVPFDRQEPWETRFGLIERAAENRMCLVAADASSAADHLIVTLPPDFTLWAPSRERTFDGTINRPDTTFGHGSTARATVHPARTVNRQISRNTDLVNGRPWTLCHVLTAEQSS